MQFFTSIVTLIILVLCQTTLLHYISISGVIPDLSLIALVFISNKNGNLLGETAGFSSGLVEDFLSLSPFGFHALLKTVLGFLIGLTHGVVFIGAIMMPMLMVGLATILKALLVSLVGIFFQTSSVGQTFFSFKTIIELGYNILISPFLFAFLGLLKFLQPKQR